MINKKVNTETKTTTITKQQSWLTHIMIIGNSIKDGAPQEITDGIRVLGTPVDNPAFCRNFISEAMKKVQEHTKTMLE